LHQFRLKKNLKLKEPQLQHSNINCNIDRKARATTAAAAAATTAAAAMAAATAGVWALKTTYLLLELPREATHGSTTRCHKTASMRGCIRIPEPSPLPRSAANNSPRHATCKAERRMGGCCLKVLDPCCISRSNGCARVINSFHSAAATLCFAPRICSDPAASSHNRQCRFGGSADEPRETRKPLSAVEPSPAVLNKDVANGATGKSNGSSGSSGGAGRSHRWAPSLFTK